MNLCVASFERVPKALLLKLPSRERHCYHLWIFKKLQGYGGAVTLEFLIKKENVVVFIERGLAGLVTMCWSRCCKLQLMKMPESDARSQIHWRPKSIKVDFAKNMAWMEPLYRARRGDHDGGNKNSRKCRSRKGFTKSTSKTQNPGF